MKYLSFPKEVLLETSLSLKKSAIVRSNYEEAIHTFQMSRNKFSHLLFHSETEPSENSVTNTASRMLCEHRKFKINSVTDQMKELVHLADLFIQLLWQVPPRGCSVRGPRSLRSCTGVVCGAIHFTDEETHQGGGCRVNSSTTPSRWAPTGGLEHPRWWLCDGLHLVQLCVSHILLLLLLLLPCPGSGRRVNQTQRLSCSEQLLLPAFEKITLSEKVGFADLEEKRSTCSPL